VKFELDLSVAGKTEVGIFGLQEFGVRVRFMHPVAISAAHGIQLVLTPLELKKFNLFLMAFQANI
jgi:hypothetical protein